MFNCAKELVLFAQACEPSRHHFGFSLDWDWQFHGPNMEICMSHWFIKFGCNFGRVVGDNLSWLGRHVHGKVSAHVDRGLPWGSPVQRPVSVDPHRGERMSYYVKKALLSPLFPELGTTMLQLRPRLMSKAMGLVWTKVEHKNRFPVSSLSLQFLVAEQLYKHRCV